MRDTKLPKAVAMMVEKNNLVRAISTLAEQENISMDEAKARIDAYETKLKADQQRNMARICERQQRQDHRSVSTKTMQPTTSSHPTQSAEKQTTSNPQDFSPSHGATKTSRYHGWQRVLLVVLIAALLFWLLWQWLPKAG